MSLKGIKIINVIDQNKCAGLMATITKHGGSYFVASLTQLLVNKSTDTSDTSFTKLKLN